MNNILLELLENFYVHDCIPTKDNVIETLNKWISNLYSHIGVEAHKHSLASGIHDKTGLSWEEQDQIMLTQINSYRECISMIQLGETCIDEYIAMLKAGDILW